MYLARNLSLLLLLLALTLGAAVRPTLAAGPIVSGETLAGTLASPTFTESWTFFGTTGDRVLLAAVTTSGAVNTNILVRAPGGGTILSTATDRNDFALTATGTYTIDISDVGLNDAGTYNLGLVDITSGPLTSAGDPNGGAMTSSDVRTGTMVAADFDAYTFSGTSGDRILVDAVTTGGSLDTWIYLYPPGGGAPIINSFAVDRAEIQLAATGTYAIVIEDNGNDTPGAYSMSLLNVTSGPFTNGGDSDGGAIVSNGIKAGQFQQGVDFDAYTFSGSAAQRIVVAGVATGAGTHNTQISVYPAGGGPAISFTTSDRFDVQLTTSGSYTLVIEDNGNNDAGAYAISFVNLTVGPYADGNDPDGGAMTSSDVRTGTMVAADFDAYTFSGTSGDRILVDAVTTSGSLDTWIYLYPPGGGAPIINSFAVDRAEIQLTATGTYAIVIEDNGNDTPGAYSMSLLNVTSGPFTNGGDSDGGAIVSNGIKAGQFQQGVDFDAYTFSGSAAQRIVVAGVATGAGAHNTQISVYPAGGGPAISFTTSDRFDVQLTTSGSYTLVIEDNGNNDAGAYAISFVNLTVGPYADGNDPDGGAMTSSDVRTGTMVAADFDAYTFSGTSGDRILVDAVTTGGSLDTWIYLYPPGGGAPIINSFAVDRAEIQLTATGTFAIVIEDNGNNTPGAYSMSLLNVTSGPFTNGGDPDGGAIVSNGIKAGQFQQGVDFDAYTFSGSAAQRIVVAGVATGAGAHNTQISVYPAGGGPAISFTTSDRFDVQLTTSGSYTLVIEDNGNNDTGAYAISFVNLTVGPYADGNDPDGGAMTSSDVRTGTMVAADFDAYTFSGTSGDRILVDAVTTGGSLDTWIYLYPPGGGAPIINSFAVDRAEIQLTATGTFAIVIEDNGNNTPGAYSMSLLNVTSGPFTNGGDPDGGAIVSNEIKAGQFQQGVDFDAYTFSGSVAQRIVVAGVATGAGAHNTQISVYPAGGGPAISFTTSDRFDVQLTTSGSYTLVIEDNGNNDTGAYAISFVNLTVGPYADGNDPDGGAMTSNEIKSGTMSGASDFDAFTFSGTSEQRVLLSAVTTAGSLDTWIYLYPPDGGAPVVNSFAVDRAEFRLTSTGTYTILIEDNGNNTTGAYNMSLLNVTVGPYTGDAETDGGLIVSGVPELGSALSAADFDGYTFWALSGDTAVVSCIVTAGPMNTQISLYPPGGGAAVVSTTSDNVNQRLNATGLYTIVIEDNAQDQTGNYTLTLTGIEEDPTDVPIDGPELLGVSSAALLPPAPSPFLNSTRLDFRVAQEGPVQLRIFDVTGSQVRSLVNETLRPGAHPVVWDGVDDHGSRVANGIYYVRLQTAGEVKQQKVVRVR